MIYPTRSAKDFGTIHREYLPILYGRMQLVPHKPVASISSTETFSIIISDFGVKCFNNNLYYYFTLVVKFHKQDVIANVQYKGITK